MKIFKELKKLGYKHYAEYTIEELDDLPLNSEERIMEQALVLRWFREKYDLQYTITWNKHYPKCPYEWEVRKTWRDELLRPYGISGMSATYEEAELAAIVKLIEIVKKQNLNGWLV